jgi:hypothetical protein
MGNTRRTRIQGKSKMTVTDTVTNTTGIAALEMPPITLNSPTMTTAAMPVTQTVTTSGTTYFTEDQLNAAREAARKEANDRLYGELKKLRDHTKELDAEVALARQEREEREAAAVQAREEAEATAQKARVEEMTAKQLLEEQRTQWELRFERLAEEQRAKEAVFAKERERSELMAYTQRRIAEERDEIAPELVDYIDGADKEAVEAAITNAKAKTASILEGVRQAGIQQRAEMPGIGAGAGNIGPVDEQGAVRQLTAEDIATLPVNSPEYQQLRRQYGMDRPAGGAGMFG